MGGKTILAIAILGWPVDKLPAELAQQVIEGARSICAEAGIALAGGHSIDCPEPIFGLAVNGIVPIENLKQNSTAREGDLLLLTKPIGIGILSTAQKRDVLNETDLQLMLKQLMQLNSAGEILGPVKGVHAMTDVTGFGLLGHLIEMSEGSKLSAQLQYKKVPVIHAAKEYLARHIVPGGTKRNWNSYGDKVKIAPGINEQEAADLLADPQTNGGLLIAVNKDALEQVKTILNDRQLCTEVIGEMITAKEKAVYVV
jgi:selenide,water dikinase